MKFEIVSCLLFLCALVMAHENLLHPPYTCTTTTTLCNPRGSTPISTSSPDIPARLGKRGPIGLKGEKGDNGDPCECDVADEMEVQKLRNEWTEMKRENQEMKKSLEELTIHAISTPESCKEYSTMKRLRHKQTEDNEALTIYPWKSLGNLTPLDVNCNMQEQDKWIVIQRRMSGSVDFYRDWDSYAKGFGDVRGDFWIGLNIIHNLTTSRNHKLRIEMRNREGEWRYAEYSSFSVEDEASNFRLSVSGYLGTAGDSMKTHNGQPFSTKDRDIVSNGCAVRCSGAWWYKNCFHSNLNGRYFSSATDTDIRGIAWSTFGGSGYSLPYVEMKIFPM